MALTSLSLPVMGERQHGNIIELTEYEQNKKAWKYKGYPALAKWMASSNDFFVLRRFGTINVRVLLMMQDRIARMELDLEKIDAEVIHSSNANARNDSLRLDVGSKREMLLDELKGALKEYNDYVSSYSGIKAQHTARREQIEFVKTWMHNHPNAIFGGPNEDRQLDERDFINHEGDIISLVLQEKSLLRTYLERFAPFILLLFPPKYRPDLVQEPGIRYTSGAAVNAVVNSLTLFLGLGLLIGPMWWLQYLTDVSKQLGVITGFLILFTVILSTATFARTFEVLASTAAYAAVLMVFLGGISSNRSN